jgi:PAS domain S-box-containing protein
MERIRIRTVKTALFPDQMLVAAFMANIPDHVYFKDRDLRFISVSRSLAEHFGRDVEELLGKTVPDLIDGELARPFDEAQLKVMATGEPLVDHVIKRTWGDGRVTWYLISVLPLRDENGEIVGTVGMNKDITAAKLMEQDLEKANRELREMSRLAGMAEAATSVVHNVGNVLNGVNVSTGMIAQGLRKFKVDQLGKLCALLRSHADDLSDFLNQPQGQQVLPFLEALHAEQIATRTQLQTELGSLEQCVAHIKEIVSIQQSYATMRGLVEDIEVHEIVEDALKMSHGAFLRHGVTIRREFSGTPKIIGERGKILQILHNLLRNAKYAVDDGGAVDKTIIVKIETATAGFIRIVVTDNGVGIPPENLTRIFAQGFTTRRGGHGFGLHSSANAAQEMRGSLIATSEGLGKGASFILELPLSKVERRRVAEDAVELAANS